MAEKSRAAFLKERPDLASVYQTGYGAHREGITSTEVAEYYSKWAETYEKDLPPGVYNGPIICGDEIARLYPTDREQVQILDIGAGSGLLGEQLIKHGFRDIDALDPATDLLKLSERKNIYNRYFKEFINEKPLPIKEGTYDCVGIAGAMGEGHIPCVALYEMVRITKPGGYVTIVMREEYLGYVTEYKDRLEPLMMELVEGGVWENVYRKVVPDYSFNNNGVVFVYKVL